MRLVTGAALLVVSLTAATRAEGAPRGLVSICAGSREACEPVCSGFALSPRVVVTARHCIAPSKALMTTCAAAAPTASVPNDRWISVGGIGAALRRKISNVTFLRSQGVCGHDIVFGLLDEPLVGVEPIEPMVGRAATRDLSLRRYAPDPRSANALVEQAYEGLALQCEPHSLDQCAASLGAVGLAANENILSVEACPGDSGGGTLDSEGRLLGLTTRSSIPSTPAVCGFSVITLLRPHLMLAARLVTSDLGNTAPPAWTLEASRVGNADDVPMGGIGMPCDEDSECTSGRSCLSANNGLDYACTRSCEHDPCESGSFCKRSGASSLCVLGEAPPADTGCSAAQRSAPRLGAPLAGLAAFALSALRRRSRRRGSARGGVPTSTGAL